MDLLQRFQDFIQAQELLLRDMHCLVAVSGGVDSMVLAELFRQSKHPFGIAHCNFRLRGEESDAEEAFVRNWAAQRKVPFFIRQFDTKNVAAEQGISIQMAARDLRYAWFEEIRTSEGFECIATAHNLNDSIETTLLHLIRGTGLTGLTGIPLRNGPIIRPLLFATRDDILAFAKTQRVEWREDSSNANDDYTRNAIRLHVLPEMLKINSNFLSGAADTMRHLHAADVNLDFLLRQILGQPDIYGTYQISKARLAQLPALADALFDLLQPFGFTADQAQQVAQCWNQTGKEWESATGNRLLLDRDELLLAQQPTNSAEQFSISEDDLMLRLPDGSSLFITPAPPEGLISEKGDAVLVNTESLRFPLLLRRWKPGDIFQPLGMGGRRQKLQDFFTNKKLSRFEKEQVWILEDAEQRIVWVVGMRLDERFMPREDSTKLTKISWVKSR